MCRVDLGILRNKEDMLNINIHKYMPKRLVPREYSPPQAMSSQSSRIGLLDQVLQLLLEVLSTRVLLRLERESSNLFRDKTHNDGIEDFDNVEALGLVRAEGV